MRARASSLESPEFIRVPDEGPETGNSKPAPSSAANAHSGRRRQRQAHGDGRPAMPLAVDGNGAVVCLYRAVGDAEPETGAASDRLGGEERLEDARQMFRGDAGTVVTNAHLDHGAVGLLGGIGVAHPDADPQLRLA